MDLCSSIANWTTVRSWKLDRDGPEERNRRQIYPMNDWFYEGVHFGLMAVYEWPTAKAAMTLTSVMSVTS